MNTQVQKKKWALLAATGEIKAILCAAAGPMAVVRTMWCCVSEIPWASPIVSLLGEVPESQWLSEESQDKHGASLPRRWRVFVGGSLLFSASLTARRARRETSQGGANFYTKREGLLFLTPFLIFRLLYIY